jgi:hypothetical protein
MPRTSSLSSSTPFARRLPKKRPRLLLDLLLAIRKKGTLAPHNADAGSQRGLMPKLRKETEVSGNVVRRGQELERANRQLFAALLDFELLQ